MLQTLAALSLRLHSSLSKFQQFNGRNDMPGGGQIGNQNAAKKDQMARMLKAALDENDRARLRKGIEKVADAFAAGERWAVEFAFERIDGRLKQSIVVESAATAEERISTVASVLAEAIGLAAHAGDEGFSLQRPVVPPALPAATH